MDSWLIFQHFRTCRWDDALLHRKLSSAMIVARAQGGFQENPEAASQALVESLPRGGRFASQKCLEKSLEPSCTGTVPQSDTGGWAQVCQGERENHRLGTRQKSGRNFGIRPGRRKTARSERLLTDSLPKTQVPAKPQGDV